VVLVKGEEGIFLVMSVGHNNGAEGVVIQGSRRFIDKVNVGVAHIFKFHKALCLFCDCVAYDILFCGRKAVREEGDQFHH